MEDLHRVSTVERAEDEYFTTNPAPWDIKRLSTQVSSFIEAQQAQAKRVVLVTSGGTTVPLENQTVRFIDNFSAGTRGATSAEYFLDAGYGVVFLHRQFSLLPYSRHYSHSTNCFLDFMSDANGPGVTVKKAYQDKTRRVLQKYNAARESNSLLLISFTTISDYLWLLRQISFQMQPLGSSALFYLAAAVSDFFIPRNRMSEHKIQSRELDGESSSGTKGQKLVIDLDPVPKFLKRLVDGWAPHGMIVSFKLETDPSLLISKARKALEQYSHHLVIGNMLVSRSYEVVLVEPEKKERWIKIPSARRKKSVTGPQPGLGPEEGSEEPQEIESLIVPEVVKLHNERIAAKTT